MTIVQLINKEYDQVHFYEEEDEDLLVGPVILTWGGKHYTYDDTKYNDAWGDYVQYRETDLRAVPNCIEVR